ncbi:hypothetical protein HanHA300_Chr15g0566941 [Helianthus annuus]|nr:hypothetical protein HanHA300_Chr15g0566941 [Helianthus annuus]KAJ0455879.1 hypothetical protein HanIR_Chr15g0756071 [Helianthus annuus]KAJ0473259.1 hypothetical protein HanHA89_Chr15g0616281 [Helianthus annuus]KAJ0652654.1 hypothetical protein HanOQP8_Chr15g0574571 [Helianthus annuus]
MRFKRICLANLKWRLIHYHWLKERYEYHVFWSFKIFLACADSKGKENIVDDKLRNEDTT